MKYIFLLVVAAGILFAIQNIFFAQRTTSPIDNQVTPTTSASDIISPTGSMQQTPTSPTPAPWLDKTNWVTTATQATITTAKGTIVIQLYNQDAPKTVANFATLAKFHFYDGLTFHRVEPGFVIQGGDPNGNGTGGISIFGPTFEDELNASSSSYQAGYKEGIVAMANRGPNTNSSQFFIMLADNTSLPKNYTIFGKVTSGLEVVHKIQVGDKMTSVTVQ